MRTSLLIPSLLLIGMAACGPRQGTSSPTVLYPLATPVSDQPAAGICASFDERLVVVTIRPDIPDPRCVKVRPDQVLEVVNSTQGQLQVHIGTFEASLEPGGKCTFEVPFGDYLAPGVHLVQVLPCCSPELWMEKGP